MPLEYLRKVLGVEWGEVSLAERIVATLGGGLAMGLVILISQGALPYHGAPAVVASMGASAVLLFAVPHGQLSQPWPVIAGHGLSAGIGVNCAKTISSPIVAASCAVGLAIGVMHLFRCIHPPGGATAFTAVMGGEAVREMGFSFAINPVISNAVGMVLLAVMINAFFPWRRYPSRARATTPSSESTPKAPGPTHEEVIKAVRSLNTFVDIDEQDLIRLVEILSHHPKTKPVTQILSKPRHDTTIPPL